MLLYALRWRHRCACSNRVRFYNVALYIAMVPPMHMLQSHALPNVALHIAMEGYSTVFTMLLHTSCPPTPNKPTAWGHVMGAIWCALITPTITGAPRRLDLAIRWQQPVVMGAIVCTIYILSLETDNFPSECHQAGANGVPRPTTTPPPPFGEQF